MTAFLLKGFSNLPPAEQKARVAALAQAAYDQPNGEIRELDDQIAAYEVRYEMTSPTMLKRLRNGELRETAEICSWRMLLRLRDRLGTTTP